MNTKKQLILTLFAVAGVISLGLLVFKPTSQRQAFVMTDNPPPASTSTQSSQSSTQAAEVHLSPGFDLGGCASIAPPDIAKTIRTQVDGFDRDFYAETSTFPGQTFIFVSNARYCLLFPSDWQVRVAGAYGNNLMFNESIATGTRQSAFLQLAEGGLPLEQADQMTVSAGEGAQRSPLVSPSEKITSKESITIGNKRVLVELSEVDETALARYFVEHDGRVTYVIQSRVPKAFIGSTAYLQFVSDLKSIISTLRSSQP